MFQNHADIKACLSILENGGILLYPTDTVWGIGCDATNEAAVSKIFTLKNRIESKAMIVLLEDETELLNYRSEEPFLGRAWTADQGLSDRPAARACVGRRETLVPGPSGRFVFTDQGPQGLFPLPRREDGAWREGREPEMWNLPSSW